MSQRLGKLSVTVLALGVGILVLAGGVMAFYLTQRPAAEAGSESDAGRRVVQRRPGRAARGAGGLP